MLGNVLGDARAEADAEMLAKAFVQTADFRSLTQTRHFNYVVGRRGTGKTALFQKVKEHYRAQPDVTLVASTPQEYEATAFQNLLSSVGQDYRLLRGVSRLAWKAHLLFIGAAEAVKHYRIAKLTHGAFLTEYLATNRQIVREQGPHRPLALIRRAIELSAAPRDVAYTLARTFDIDRLQQAVVASLDEAKKRPVVLFDALDEGWLPDVSSTAVIGGLALAAAELADARSEIYPVLFIRDNIFRSLAELDPDFTRHIEGRAIRLHWDERSLFHLVAERLRVALGLPSTENDVKVWNRFAHAELKEREGFERCLRLTLYRPRDILVLLNDAFAMAQKEGRQAIVGADVEASAVQTSQHRLNDLIKEYDTVFPGLADFISLFRGRPAQITLRDALDLLQAAALMQEKRGELTSPFALFETPQEIFGALYSVGFLGIQEIVSGRFTFCHDGAASAPTTDKTERLVTVHPCYWKALGLTGDTPPEEVMVQINDEYAVSASRDVAGLRTRRLGQIHGELAQIPHGADGAADFERWVHRALVILFEGHLRNIQLKPNPSAVHRRDIVATNMAERGFWKRVYDDYKSRQVLFEVKNYGVLEPDDFRQVLSYTSGEYGRFAAIVYRPGVESPTETDKTWLRSMYLEHSRLILLLPEAMVARCLLKLRSPRKIDYADEALGKLVDVVIRAYLGIPSAKPFRRKRH